MVIRELFKSFFSYTNQVANSISVEQIFIQQPLVPSKLLYTVNGERNQQRYAVVDVGDTVKQGQVIATDQLGGLALHVACDGVVKAIEQRPTLHPVAISDLTIEVEPTLNTVQNIDVEELDFQQIMQAEINKEIKQLWFSQIENAGIVGMGGAGFPTLKKIQLAEQNYIHSLIINACECEPIISCDDMLMQYQCEEFIKGAMLITKLLEVNRCIIIIEDDKHKGIQKIQKNLQDLASISQCSIELKVVDSKYPSGHERQLVESIADIKITSEHKPYDFGYAIFNVATVHAIYKAIVCKKPLISRIVTVSDGEKVVNAQVFIGTPIKELLHYVGFSSLIDDTNRYLISGGPMNGLEITCSDVGILKTSNSILSLAKENLLDHYPCIRCGDCVSVCPENLLPQQLFWYAQAENHAKAQEQRLFDCIECGNCAYVCPSQIPLVQYYRRQKKQIRDVREEDEQTEIAKQRFEYRTQRLENEKIEHQRKLAEKREQARQKLRERQQSQKSNESAIDIKENKKVSLAVAAAQARAVARKK